jgi:23S rRNA (cytosine1962-C5)-methyltransferase
MLSILLTKDAVKKVTKGDPWIFAGMIEMTSELQMADSGMLVNILDHRAKPLGVGYFNPKSQLACRVLSLQPNTVINQRFFANLFKLALSKREKAFEHPYYRLVHSESDFLPGLIVDRFGDTAVCQTSTAGMENLKPIWLPALQELLESRNIVLKDDVPVRKKEGLIEQVSIYIGEVPDIVEVKEHNCIYYANLLTGQKTGWFYDQRANRHYFASLVKDKNVLDIYSHSGGFGIAAAKGGAAKVTMVDSSALALELAQKAATRNGIEKQCNFTRSDAYEYLEACVKDGKKFEAIMADPPAFIKERKYTASGLKGYSKLAFLCASALEKDGIFSIASCSHHASARDFRKAVEQGIAKSGRSFELIHKAGADKDHPVHPSLEESQYLKFMTVLIS